MSADRELLVLAAKAAGIDAEFHPELGYSIEGMWLKGKSSPDNSKYWNPLTDDGDALRLAVKLGICFGPNFDNDTAVAFGREGRNICEPYDEDQYAATRRALVRVAAETGKAMP